MDNVWYTSCHIHLLIGLNKDISPEKLLYYFKRYGSRALNEQFEIPVNGTWWTANGSTRKIDNTDYFQNTYRYILNQENPLEVWENERSEVE